MAQRRSNKNIPQKQPGKAAGKRGNKAAAAGIDHNLATAQVFVQCLSLFFRNTTTGAAGVVFVKEMHSPVSINIFQGSCQNLIWSSDNKWDFPYSMSDVLITVNSAKPHMPGSVNNNPNDPEDFDALPNLAQLLNQATLPFRPTARHHLTARLDINDATFYTFKKTASNAILLPSNQNLGRIGRVMGADIICGPHDPGVDIAITIPGGIVHRISLPKGQDQYFICVETMPMDPGSGHIPFVLQNILQPPQDSPSLNIQYAMSEAMVSRCPSRMKRSTDFACQVLQGGGDPPAFP